MSLMVMKQQVYRHLNMPLGESMRDTNKLMAESLKRDDFREGVRSFMERRPPQFKPLKVESLTARQRRSRRTTKPKR